MTRVAGPLFGSAAVGRVGRIGTFRRGRHGPEFIRIAQGGGGDSEAQRRLRACFAAAKAAHSEIAPTLYMVGKQKRYHRLPSWPVFWTQWLADHPECI